MSLDWDFKSQYSDSFQVFVKADFVLHKTITGTAYRHPRIPFITYLHFQTARPEPWTLSARLSILEFTGQPNHWFTAGSRVISYHLDSVKPKIMKKRVFRTFSVSDQIDKQKSFDHPNRNWLQFPSRIFSQVTFSINSRTHNKLKPTNELKLVTPE